VAGGFVIDQPMLVQKFFPSVPPPSRPGHPLPQPNFCPNLMVIWTKITFCALVVCCICLRALVRISPSR
jgi:hypothetical protein